jgi:hypothetical protein
MTTIICGNEPYLVAEEISKATEGTEVVCFDDLTNLSEINLALDMASCFIETTVLIDSCSPTDFLKHLNSEHANNLIVKMAGCDRRTKVFQSLSSQPNVTVTICDKSIKRASKLIVDWGCGKISSSLADKIIKLSDYARDPDISIYTLGIYAKELLLLSDGEHTCESFIDEVISPREADCFALSDRLLKKDCAGLFKITDNLLSRGENEIKLLSLVQRPFKLAYLSKMAGTEPGSYSSLLKYDKEKLCCILDIIQNGIDRLKSGTDMVFKIVLLEILQEL